VLLLVGKLGSSALGQAALKTCLDYCRDTPALGTAQSQQAQSSGVLLLSHGLLFHLKGKVFLQLGF